MENSKEINELYFAIHSAKNIPKDFRYFIVSENQFLRVYNGGKFFRMCFDENKIVTSLKLDRGQILDLFSKLEFFVNELILLRVLGLNSDKNFMLDDILEYVDFFSRVKILRQWNIIDGTLSDLLMQTKQVRNGFAHAWDASEVSYKGYLITASFAEFKKDMEQIWKQLVTIYNDEFQKIDKQKIIDEISKLKALRE